MIRYRPFRNNDPPALVRLWNQGLPDRHVVRPVVVHDWDAMVAGKPYFDPAGLIVAEREGKILGFAHAGFGPYAPSGPSHRLDTAMGTIAMLVLEPGLDDAELERGLIEAAERYLRGRGAQVLYAGGRHPIDPFYWGFYGGSEFSGVLGAHESFHRALRRSGYEAVSTAVLLQYPLAEGEPREPRLAMLRRQTRLDVIEDSAPLGWWSAIAIGPFRPTLYRLYSRSEDRLIASAMTWEIASELAGGGPNQTGLIHMEVASGQRRKGFGRLLVAEILRHCRNMLADVVCVQTLETNEAALGLYEGTGFLRDETSTLYRLPTEFMGRSGDRPN